MSIVAIRVDATIQAGSGHLWRCARLADKLSLLDHKIVFVGYISNTIPGFEILKLGSAKPKDKVRDSCDNAMKPWPHTRQVADADKFIRLLRSRGFNSIEAIVVDHYGLGDTWERRVIEAWSSIDLIVIDDLANRSHKNANALIDQNFYGEKTDSRYDQLVRADCIKLLGPRYALLSPEYAELRVNRTCARELKRILIYFGSADNLGLTKKAIRTLSAKVFRQLELDVVLGQFCDSADVVRQLASERPRTFIHAFLPTLAPLLLQADLAIGAGGSSTLERACLGLPSLVAVTSENERANTNALAYQNCLSIVSVDTNEHWEELRVQVLNMIHNPNLLEVQRTACMGLVDGCGAARVAAAINSLLHKASR